MMISHTCIELKPVNRTHETGEKSDHPPTGPGHGPDISKAILYKERDQAYESVPSASDCVLPRV